MIENLTVENYRSFQNYSMNNLKRVNLLTGLNNSGKTSLLEAVEILAAAGETRHLLDISARREEYIVKDDSEQLLLGDPRAFFYHRTLKSPIKIGTTKWNVELKVDRPEIESVGYNEGEVLLVERNGIPFTSPRIHIPTRLKGGFNGDDRRASWGGVISHFERFCPVLYLGTNKIGFTKIASLWDELTKEGSEELAQDALRLLDGRVSRIEFISTERRIYIGLNGKRQLAPIGSHGEGMQRMFGIALMLASVKGGILLVDEIDTGLHYSVLADMWKLVIGTAIKNDIQVFATTHSLDCLRGLNEACQANPEYASEISLQTIKRNLNQSVDTDAEGLAASLMVGVEVR